MPADLPLDYIRYQRTGFRSARAMMAREPERRLEWRTVAQNYIWRLRQVRAECPRRKVRNAPVL